MKIIKIIRFENSMIKGEYGYSNFMGYEMETDQGFVTIAVDNVSACCESFGAVDNLPNLEYFNGSNIVDIQAVEVNEKGEWRDSKSLDNKIGDYGEEVLEAGFIKIVTDKDTFDMSVYNNHNGYYGHEVIVKKTKSSCLDQQNNEDDHG